VNITHGVSQHFILFVTYESVQLARVVYYTRLERFANDKNSSLLVPFTSYKKFGVLWKWPLDVPNLIYLFISALYSTWELKKRTVLFNNHFELWTVRTIRTLCLSQNGWMSYWLFWYKNCYFFYQNLRITYAKVLQLKKLRNSLR